MRYVRALYPGGTYFFTDNLAKRSRTLLVDCVGHSRETVHKVKQVHPFNKILSIAALCPTHTGFKSAKIPSTIDSSKYP